MRRKTAWLTVHSVQFWFVNLIYSATQIPILSEQQWFLAHLLRKQIWLNFNVDNVKKFTGGCRGQILWRRCRWKRGWIFDDFFDNFLTIFLNFQEAAEANSSDDEAAENGDEDQEQEEEQEETPPRRTKKSKRSVELPTKKKAKKEQQAAPATSSKKGLSNLLGKRKSAARASEKIASFVEEEGTASGNSSENEESTGNGNSSDKKSAVKDLDFESMAADDEGAKGERQSTRLRGKPATSAKQLKEQRMSADSGLSKAQAKEVARSKAQTKRRRALDEELLNMYNPAALEELLNNMMKHKDGWPFDRPITRSDAPDYFEIIKKPLDLGTIRTALLHMKYTCNQEVLSDIKIVFGNCYRYNAEDAEEYQCAGRLEKYFEKIARKLGLVEEEDLENQPLSKKSRRTL